MTLGRVKPPLSLRGLAVCGVSPASSGSTWSLERGQVHKGLASHSQVFTGAVPHSGDPAGQWNMTTLWALVKKPPLSQFPRWSDGGAPRTRFPRRGAVRRDQRMERGTARRPALRGPPRGAHAAVVARPGPSRLLQLRKELIRAEGAGGSSGGEGGSARGQRGDHRGRQGWGQPSPTPGRGSP